MPSVRTVLELVTLRVDEGAHKAELEDALASTFQFCPNVAQLTAESPAPVRANAEGRYPAPIPGAWKEI